MASMPLIGISNRSCHWSVVWCEVYIYWTSLYGPYTSTFPRIYFDSHNWKQIGPLEAHIGILILQCYISFHPIFTPYVLYSDLRSDETIPFKDLRKNQIESLKWLVWTNSMSRGDFVRLLRFLVRFSRFYQVRTWVILTMVDLTDQSSYM